MKRTLPVLAALLLLAACSSQPPAPEQRPSGVEDRQPSSATTAPVRQEGVDAYGVAALKDPKNILSKREVFFDFDSFVVKSEYQPLIEAHAKFLAANPKFKVLIQGNTDERGSREYNLSLGQKRSDAVKRSLILLGVKEARTSLSWSCIEGVRPFLAGRSWVPIGSRYETVADRRTLDGYLKGCIKRATAGWVAALLERAGIIEIDRQPPARVRLR